MAIIISNDSFVGQLTQMSSYRAVLQGGKAELLLNHLGRFWVENARDRAQLHKTLNKLFVSYESRF